MNIVITSGKGGVGKTFVATNLAKVLADSQPVTFIDCDVEAPNGWLFLQPENTSSRPHFLKVPTGTIEGKCDGCGLCAKTCHYNALGVIKNDLMIFPELCHWCGACQLVCPNDAIKIGEREIGQIYSAKAGDIDMHWATLQAAAGGFSPKLISELKTSISSGVTISDSPPGTGCATVETIQDADIVVLVGDATPFGTHDLKLSINLCRDMGIEPYIVINRTGLGDISAMRKMAEEKQLTILAELPDSDEIAKLYSSGELAVDHLDDIKVQFQQLGRDILALPCKAGVKCESSFSELALQPALIGPREPEEEPQGSLPELVVLSGKGGVGKTSISACFAQMASGPICDCDVDAADLHLLLQPKILDVHEFSGGRAMSIDPEKCIACGQCAEHCLFDAIDSTSVKPVIKDGRCEGCGACMVVCPAGAITTRPVINGQWYFSDTRMGKLAHATLIPGQENSGKLVSVVRQKASGLYRSGDLAVLDGPPGTGCPVIASLGGAKFAVLVTEPTVSGLHDLERICQLVEHFKVPAGVIINKADINPAKALEIQTFAKKRNLKLLGEMKYDTAFTDAQQAGKTILEHAPASELSQKLRVIWDNINNHLINRS